MTAAALRHEKFDDGGGPLLRQLVQDGAGAAGELRVCKVRTESAGAVRMSVNDAAGVGQDQRRVLNPLDGVQVVVYDSGMVPAWAIAR